MTNKAQAQEKVPPDETFLQPRTPGKTAVGAISPFGSALIDFTPKAPCRKCAFL
jgi:hypothetical protein